MPTTAPHTTAHGGAAAAPASFSASTPRLGVLLCNLGTPDAPTPAAVKRYLAEFLSDPRVVELPQLLWQPLLRLAILPLRAKESARKYEKIWRPEEGGSPLLNYTRKQALMLRGWLGEAGLHDVDVQAAMRYGQPGIVAQLERWHTQGVEKMLLLPLYPQYSATTTASVIDQAHAWAGSKRNMPELRIVKHYADDAGYIAALARRTLEHWQTHGRPEVLVMSYHGIPARNVAKGDPYAQQCQQSATLLAQQLGLQPAQYRVTFQSRFGPAQWLQPYTQPTLEQLAREGVKTVDLICPGFSSDCLETLEEIDMEVRQAFLAHGGQEFRYIPCLNDHPAWISALRDLVLRNTAHW